MQTLLLSICTAGILAVGKIGWDASHELTRLRVEQARTNEHQAELAAALKATQSRFDAYMPRTEIDTRFASVHAAHVEHDRRITTLERRRP